MRCAIADCACSRRGKSPPVALLECGLPGETAIRTCWHVAVRVALPKRMKCRDVVDGIMACWATTAGRIHTAAGD